jgi:hypothetical protein
VVVSRAPRHLLRANLCPRFEIAPWNYCDFAGIEWISTERCVHFEATKFGPGKAPFMGEMETYLQEQKALRDQQYPDCPYVFFWFICSSSSIIDAIRMENA